MLKLIVTGNLRAAMEREVRAVSAAMRRATQTAGKEVQDRLRQQARSLSWRDGGKSLANAWRLKVYPPPGISPRTLKPAALIYSNMPQIVRAFEEGATIRHKGGRYLIWPTGFNRTGGRRGGKPRVTAAQMTASKKSFLRPFKSGRGFLWCLPVKANSGAASRSARRGLTAGGIVSVATGKDRGRLRRKEVLAQGFVPMFFMMREVRLAKALDVASVRGAAATMLARAAAAEFARLPPILSDAPR